ncbi:glycoside hydrolase family 15 protein [Streptomyces sp. RB6PN25]|uniref:Glycoside hydrolase family 15 protein n=1 Tax=Streptomyces humicola TaxID=2953240 RepID=A0ABT1Q1F6_9ACTN|nr:glycoside hydrolase family 15 protein [Streptomyces humicola]MCQ4083749.1 glycoside hydrolase family 15 protein [Streptomyces humicola]
MGPRSVNQTLAYPPHVLRDYAVVADGERGALIGPRGDIAWMCAPRWDSEALFCALIGGRGCYAVTPVGTFVWGGSYQDGTLIWRNRWVTQDGVVECEDALALPADPHRAVVLRRILPRDAAARMRIVLGPYACFGRQQARFARQGEQWTGEAGPLHLRWSGACAAGESDVDGSLAHELTVPAGGSHDLVLEISDRPLRGTPVDASRAWAATRAAWERAVPSLESTIAPRDARQAYAVLRGMTGASGGMVAAATTSLPERAAEGRNYDYRYVWIRDQCYAGQAAAATGAYPLLDEAVRFASARLHEDGPALSPAYAVDGGAVPEQRPLDLPGYPGGFDVIGNRAAKQFQLDPFGEALLLFSAAARLGRLDVDGWRAAEIAAAAIGERWRAPDAGIWELDDRAWTHSRLICAAGLRAIALYAPPPGRAGQWAGLADAIIADTAAHATHPSGRWQRSPDDPRLDAALLFAPVRGAVPPDDPRSALTLRAYLSELTQEHYAYRFRHDERPLNEAEGAFLLCGFLTALAEHQQGHELEAVRWFERNRAACGPPGLFAEEFDVPQRQLRGNLPQAFVHALMLECAARLADQTAPAR